MLKRANRDSRRDRRRAGFKWMGAILVLSIVILLPTAAWADDGPTQDEVNAVSRKLFCPVCENTPLDVCPTEACQQWRDVIQTRLVEGQSEQEILDYFAEMYGDSVLAQPPPRQWAAWALPVLFLVLGAAALVFWLRSWTKPVPIAAQVVTEEQIDGNQPHTERLERELTEWE